MGNDLRKILVVDLEATCWANDPEKQQRVSEIIEIGGAVLNTSTLKIEKAFDHYVWPIDHPEITCFCTELTGITEKILEKNGQDFHTRCYQILQYCKDNGIVTWGSWGNYDRAKVETQCLNYKDYPFPYNHINIKILEAMVVGRRGGKSVTRALENWGLKFEGRPHNGYDDAYNIARILREIITRGR